MLNLSDNNDKNSLFEKFSFKLNLFLYKTKKFIFNCNTPQRLYLIGNFAFVVSIFSALLIYFPLAFLGITLGAILFIFYKYKTIPIKDIREWTTANRFLRVFSALAIVIVGEYLFFKYYPIPSEIKYIQKYINSFGLLNSLSLIGMSSLSAGFIIETSYFWDKRNKIVDKAIYILGAISSFFSLYLARCIIVVSTGLEPATFSRASIIFSLTIGGISWLILSVLVLSSIYAWTIFYQIFSYFIKLIFQKKTAKTWIESLIFEGGRGIGAGIIALLSCFILLFIPHAYSINPLFFNHIAENVIVYADYRPKLRFSECTNIKDDEWGLLVGNKKVSIAQPKKFGGYTFTTKLCLFDE